MTKEQLQKELKEKIKPGVKASDLKKLKRSKSADDIPATPPSPTVKIKGLEDKISVLELTVETKDRELATLESENKELKKNPPNLLLTDQLKTKQQELEKLRANLEATSSELNLLKKEKSTLLDTNLELKHQNLKDWFTHYQKNQELETELKENIDYASTELLEQDKVISDLRTEISKLKLTNQSLQKDLNLATKLAELRKDYLPTNSPPIDYLKYALYSLVAVCFISLLNASWKYKR